MDTATVLAFGVAASAAVVLAACVLAGLPRFVAALPRPGRSPAALGLVVTAAALAVLGRAPAWAATPPPMLRIERPLEPAAAPPLAAAGSAAVDVGAAALRHKVEAGDTLWGIAARELRDRTGATPDGAEVSRHWRRIYEANRDLIGSDPDLIFPGQMLVVPRGGN